MKQQFKMYRIPSIAMVAIAAGGIVAIFVAAFYPAEAPLAGAVLALFAAAVCAIAAVRFAREVALRGADHITDALRGAQRGGSEIRLHHLEYLPRIFAPKGREPWVGILVWEEEGGATVSSRVYGHGNDHAGIPRAATREIVV